MTALELTSADVGVAPAASEAAWPFAKRFGFAFVVALLFIMNWPFPLGYVPGTDAVGDWLAKPWEVMVPYVATHVFHVPADVRPNGSGDTTYNYVQQALMTAMALVAALIWAAWDRKASRYERVHRAFRVYLRFALASAMILYGTVKIIPSQFPPPTLDRLVEPFGAASPMGLLWTFMGASHAYNVLTGSVELLGGILLATRRTTLLGALVSAGAMANVVVLNFCYEVPVKLYSMQLFLQAVVIAAPDFIRLPKALLREEQGLFRKRWAVRASAAAGVLLVGFWVVFGFQRAYGAATTSGYLSPRSPLRGVWSVDELTDNGVARPPLTTDVDRWRRVIFDSPRFGFIQYMSDARLRYRMELDEKAHSIKLTDWENEKRITTLAYVRPDPRTLVLDTTLDGHKLHAVCHLSDASSLLTTRGFHWINEYPFNR